jgi:hypothetical protein
VKSTKPVIAGVSKHPPQRMAHVLDWGAEYDRLAPVLWALCGGRLGPEVEYAPTDAPRCIVCVDLAEPDPYFKGAMDRPTARMYAVGGDAA